MTLFIVFLLFTLDYYLIIIRINIFSIIFFVLCVIFFSWSYVVKRLDFPTLGL